jgi:hypothetical protein
VQSFSFKTALVLILYEDAFMYLSSLVLVGIKSILLDVELMSSKKANSISSLASVEMYNVTDFKTKCFIGRIGNGKF